MYYASDTELEIFIFIIICIHHKYPETDFISFINEKTGSKRLSLTDVSHIQQSVKNLIPDQAGLKTYSLFY